VQCLYCSGPVIESNGLVEAEFCSDDHRFRYEAVSRLGWPEDLCQIQPPSATVGRGVPSGPLLSAPAWIYSDAQVKPPETGLAPASQPSLKTADDLRSLLGIWSFEPTAPVRVRGPVCGWVTTPYTKPRLPSVNLPLRRPAAPKSRPWQRVPALWRRLPAIWQRMPPIWGRVPPLVRQIALTAPFFLAAVFVGIRMGWIPKYTVGGARYGVVSAVSSGWSAIGEHIRQRAAIEFSDDFHDGLNEWRSRSNATGSWSPASWAYDAAGFVQPGRLALYRPTVELMDYRLEFVAQIDQKGMGFVVRAPDASNYHAVNLVVVHAGPLPDVQVVRYAVIQGREGPHVVRPLTIPVRNDMWYRVRLDVLGRNFTLIIQDRVADYWTDGRLQQGGVGFFCGRGEHARLRWVKVSHQYDAIGRLCAYLAPHGSQFK
jgi:hypothetical protein